MSKLLAVCLCLLAIRHASAAAAPQWIEVQSPHFVVVTDSNEKQARKVAGQFERMRAVFQMILPHADGDASLPITVLALKDRKSFQALEPAAYLSKGQMQLAGLFMTTRDRNYILLRLDTEDQNPYATVYHEYTHFLMRKAEWMPLWLNEGIAEFYQNTEIEEKDARVGKPSAEDILYLREHTLIPLQTLFAVDHNSPYYHQEEKGSVFYAQSWALTHLLEMNDFKNKTQRVQDYVVLVAKGVNQVDAAQQAFGDLAKLQKLLSEYISHNSYEMFRVNSPFHADEASFQSRAIPAADADAIRASVLANDGREKEATDLLTSVLRDDPKNALAHETMGSIAHRSGDIAAARKWYGEAVQLDSQSYLANFYYATLTMTGGEGGQDATIESSLRQSIKLEPHFAPAYDALSWFYGSRHKNLDEAYRLSLRAIGMEPTQVSYRLNAIQIQVELKNYDNALRGLALARQVAKTPAEGAMIDARVRQVQEMQSFETQAGSAASEGAASAQHGIRVRAAEAGEERSYPAPQADAKRHTVNGVIHKVKCSYPTVLAFSLEDEQGKATALFTPNYYKVPFATVNFQPAHDLDPCKAIEGMKASAEYVDVTDKEFAGQLVTVELTR